MAKKLTGMDIFKLLPKTNCGECGVPTCMAFAMKLAQKNASITGCPHASGDAIKIIGESNEPPIRLVRFGPAGRTIEIGNELVMFRHEKTFVHQTVLAVQIDSDRPIDEIAATAARMEAYSIDRAGEKLYIEALLVNDRSPDADRFTLAVAAAAGRFSGAIVLKSDNADHLIRAAEKVLDRIPLLHACTSQSPDSLVRFVVEKKLPVAIYAPTLDGLYALAGRLIAAGHRDLVLDTTGMSASETLRNNTIIRKAALFSSGTPIGSPLMNFATGQKTGLAMVADAATLLCKYASILVIDRSEAELLLPLLMARQNIYSDPQKPIQVEPRIYHLGEPGPSSPLLVTVNFSLTYFIVSGEIEGAGVPAHLAVIDTEGMSVLTAWAAGKFSAEKIAAFVKTNAADAEVIGRRLIIPGYVAGMSGELEEKMDGWEILVGPQEASDIGPFIKRFAP